MTETETTASLSTQPATGLTLHAVRERMLVAIVAESLAPALAVPLVSALAHPSPVQGLCDAFDLLAPVQASLSDVILARAIEVADQIALGQFHHKTEAATAFALSARAALAPL